MCCSVFHGFPYSGQYGNTTWPGFTTFNYQYSNMNGPHQPAWEYYADYMDFVARTNWAMQSGVPKMDIAIWQKVTTYPGHVQLRTYEPTDLEMMGYTYEYLSPNNFDLPSAHVTDGVLAPEAQAFRAMVVRANDSMTIEGVSKLVEFARAGLPIILAGGIPSTYVGTFNPMELRKSKRTLGDAALLPNVHVIDEYHVASTIASLGIQPRTHITSIVPTNATWFTNWRQDKENDIDYVFIYNDAMDIPQGQGSSEATVEFSSGGTPFEYDTWTGEQRPVLVYNTTANSTIIPLKLAGNQSTVIAFQHGVPVSNTTHLSHTPDDIMGYSYQNGTLMLKVASAAAESSRYTSNNAPSVANLSNWTLTVEHWDPPADLYNITGGAYKHNTTHHLTQLVSWQEIAGLQNVSGRGYYSTTFNWPPSSIETQDGAILDFGWVYHTLEVSLNGHLLPPLDVTSPKVDIKQWLVAGENKLEAVVATPLGNALVPIWYKLLTSGEGPGSPDASTVPPPVGDYGLQANVTVTPYREVEVR